MSAALVYVGLIDSHACLRRRCAPLGVRATARARAWGMRPTVVRVEEDCDGYKETTSTSKSGWTWEL
jgi:hypothetical protein